MLKKLFALMLSTSAAWAFAAVDLNRASVAELDSIKGVGPATSARIVEARKQGPFKNWDDFIERVQGVGEGNAARFSKSGVTINGQSFQPHPTSPAPNPASKTGHGPKK